jgi:hypothetical protein
MRRAEPLSRACFAARSKMPRSSARRSRPGEIPRSSRPGAGVRDTEPPRRSSVHSGVSWTCGWASECRRWGGAVLAVAALALAGVVAFALAVSGLRTGSRSPDRAEMASLRVGWSGVVEDVRVPGRRGWPAKETFRRRGDRPDPAEPVLRPLPIWSVTLTPYISSCDLARKVTTLPGPFQGNARTGSRSTWRSGRSCSKAACSADEAAGLPPARLRSSRWRRASTRSTSPRSAAERVRARRRGEGQDA